MKRDTRDYFDIRKEKIEEESVQRHLAFNKAMAEIDALEPLQSRDGQATIDTRPEIKEICKRHRLDYERILNNILWEDSRGLLGKKYYE